MLDIPTAKGARAGTRTPEQREQFGTRTPEQRERYLGRQAAPTTGMTPQTAAPPGATSLAEAPPTALSQTTPYAYSAQPWNDPVAQSTMKSWYEDPTHGFAGVNRSNPGGGTGFFKRSLANAQAYDKNPGVYHSEIDPARFNAEQKQA